MAFERMLEVIVQFVGSLDIETLSNGYEVLPHFILFVLSHFLFFLLVYNLSIGFPCLQFVFFPFHSNQWVIGRREKLGRPVDWTMHIAPSLIKSLQHLLLALESEPRRGGDRVELILGLQEARVYVSN